MIEIDFIPEWYRADQNRKRRYHRLHAMLGLLLAALIGWNFALGRCVHRAQAEADATQAVIDAARQRVDEAVALQDEICDISQKTSELETLASRTKTTAIIAELSWLAGENIVLSKLSFSAEAMDIKASPQQANVPGAVVQVKQEARKDKTPAPCRTKIMVSGIAAMPADAAALIYRLEQSKYFEQVVPVFTRAKTIKENDVTEFEIRCYVADYSVK